MRSGINSGRSLMAGALAAGTLAAGSLTAGAAPITLVNPSFEMGNEYPNVPTGFTNGGTGGGAYVDPSSQNRTTPTNDLRTDVGTGGDGGFFAAFAYGRTGVTQTTAHQIQLGDMFTLTVAVGDSVSNNQDDTAANYVGRVKLLIDGTVVSSNTLAQTGDAPAGGFADAFTTYTAQAGDVGKFITVGFGTPGGNQPKLYADNFRLDVVAVPEPGTFVSLAGGAALLGMRRRRRSA